MLNRETAENAWFDELTMSAHPEPVEGWVLRGKASVFLTPSSGEIATKGRSKWTWKAWLPAGVSDPGRTRTRRALVTANLIARQQAALEELTVMLWPYDETREGAGTAHLSARRRKTAHTRLDAACRHHGSP